MHRDIVLRYNVDNSKNVFLTSYLLLLGRTETYDFHASLAWKYSPVLTEMMDSGKLVLDNVEHEVFDLFTLWLGNRFNYDPTRRTRRQPNWDAYTVLVHLYLLAKRLQIAELGNFVVEQIVTVRKQTELMPTNFTIAILYNHTGINSLINLFAQQVAYHCDKDDLDYVETQFLTAVGKAMIDIRDKKIGDPSIKQFYVKQFCSDSLGHDDIEILGSRRTEGWNPFEERSRKAPQKAHTCKPTALFTDSDSHSHSNGEASSETVPPPPGERLRRPYAMKPTT